VGSDPITLATLLTGYAAKAGHKVNGSSLTQGIITDGYLPSVADTSNSWVQLFNKIRQQYVPKLPQDFNVSYGMAVGYTFVQAMFKAGRNPTRQDLVNAINGGLPQAVGVAPYAFSATNHNGFTGSYMGKIENGVVVQIGPVQTTDTSATGAITTYSTPQPAAPASGIPSP